MSCAAIDSNSVFVNDDVAALRATTRIIVREDATDDSCAVTMVVRSCSAR